VLARFRSEIIIFCARIHDNTRRFLAMIFALSGLERA
jgi:hypothetical protein